SKYIDNRRSTGGGAVSYESDDPFAGGQSHPSVSWKGAPVGTVVSGTVVDLPKEMRGRDYETGDPASWPNGDPLMVVVVNIETAEGPRSLWAQRPSAMFAAIREAQKQAGARIALGGRLDIKYTGDLPNAKNPRLNPAKQFAVRYTPPANDPF